MVENGKGKGRRNGENVLVYTGLPLPPLAYPLPFSWIGGEGREG